MSKRVTRLVKRGPISASDLVAQLSSDPNREALRREFDLGLEKRSRLLREAEQPILEDLRNVGVKVTSVWDFVNSDQPYPAALPVLIHHLEKGGYPDRVMESLGRAMAVKPAVTYWARLADLYRAPRGTGEEDGVAVALAACASADQLDDLIDFLTLVERGTSRIHFLRAIRRVGGERGRNLVDSLRSDPLFGKEARALSKR